MALGALAVVGCAAEPDLKLPTEPKQSGFVTGEDSLPFPNFGGSTANTSLGANGLARMFGPDKVCASVGPDGDCRPTQVARTWLDRINQSMSGGRCEGFAVLSGLIELGLVDPRPLGGSSARDLPKNAATTREIAYWFATQFLPVTGESTRALSGKEAVAFLSEEYAKPADQRDLWRVGLMRMDASGATKGGHAILATGVEPDPTQAGRFLIRVYDNNHPADTERAIVVDAKANRWEYRAATNPAEADALYEGTQDNQNLLLLSPLRPRTGVQPCRFCEASGGDQSAPLSQVFGSASGDVTVTDAQGQQVGVVAGRAVNTLPGASLQPLFSDPRPWEDTVAPVAWVPSTGALAVAVRPRAGAASTEAPSMAVVGAGWTVGTSGVAPDGPGDEVAFQPGGRGVEFRPGARSLPTLALVQTAAGGAELRVEVVLPTGVATVKADADPASGAVGLAVAGSSGASVPVGLAVTKADGEGEQTFEGEVTVPAQGSVTAQTAEWKGEGEPLSVDVDADGDGTADQTLSVVDTGPVGVPPLAPLDLAATLRANPPAVSLAWRDVSTSESGYELERSVDGAPFAVLSAPVVNAVAAVDVGVAREHDYRYRLRAVNPAGPSAWVEAAASFPAAPPANLRATTARCDLVELSWVDSAAQERAYRVERAVGGNVFTLLARLPADSTAFHDGAVEAGQAATYRVVSEGPGGEATASVVVSVPAVPAGPSSILVTSAGHAVDVAWSAVGGARSYTLERAEAGRAFGPLAVSVAGTTNWRDDTAAEETSYRYRVRVETAQGPSAWTQSAFVSLAPPGPQGLAVSAVGVAGATLSWVDRAQHETGYRIERSASGLPFQVISTTGPDLATWVEQGLLDGVTYTWRVTVLGAGGETSATVSATTLALPRTPSGLDVTAFARSVVLTWMSPGDATSFELERRRGAGAWSAWTTAAGTDRSASDPGLVEGEAVAYRVRALGPNGASPWADFAPLITPPAGPTDLALAGRAPTSVTLVWVDHATAETAYRVERAPRGGAFQPLATLPADAQGYQDDAVSEAAAWTWRVVAVGPGGETSSTLDDDTPPLAPTGLSAALLAGVAPTVEVAWTDESAGEQGYEVQRSSTGGGAWTTLPALAAGTTALRDSAPTFGQVLQYRVRALGVVPSTWAPVATVTTPPTAPLVVRVAPGGSDALGDGSALAPYATPAGALAATAGVPGAVEVRVAEGTYVVGSSLSVGTNRALRGGFTTAAWSVADPAAHPVVLDGRTASAAAVVVAGDRAWLEGVQVRAPSGAAGDRAAIAVRASARLSRVEVQGDGAGGGNLAGVKVEAAAAGPVWLEDSKLTLAACAGCALGAATGVEVDAPSALVRVARVRASLDWGGPSASGVRALRAGALDVGASLLDVGSPGAFAANACALDVGAVTGPVRLVHDTVRFGAALAGTPAAGVCLTSGTSTSLVSSLVFARAAGEPGQACVRAPAGAALVGNDLFDCAVLVAEGTSPLTTLAQVNARPKAHANQALDLVDGTNSWFVDEAADLHPRAGGSAAFLSFKTSAAPVGSPFDLDLDGAPRTWSGGAGGTPGAWEQDQ